MSIGQGNIIVQQKKEPASAVGNAVNGLSVEGGNAVLGNVQNGAAAVLLDNREIPMAGFTIGMLNGAGQRTSFSGQSVELLNDASILAIFQRVTPGTGPVIQLVADEGNGEISQLFFDNGNSADLLQFLSQSGSLYLQAAPNDPTNITLALFDKSGSVSIGAVGGTTINNTVLQVTDPNRRIAGRANVPAGATVDGLRLDFLNELYSLGDIAGLSGNTYLLVNDPVNEIELNGTLSLSGPVKMNGVPGFSGTVSPVTSITVDNGIVTNVS